jgi:hypothetical protein
VPGYRAEPASIGAVPATLARYHGGEVTFGSIWIGKLGRPMSDTKSRVEDKNTASGPGMREWRVLAVVLVGSFMAGRKTVQGGLTVMFAGLALMLLVLHLIAVIGTALFGSGSGQSSRGKLMPTLTHTAQTATVVNLAFVAAAFLCAFGLPKTLAADRAEENS